MKTYLCRDNQGGEVEIEAETPRAAAQAYVDGGDWGDLDYTIWISVRVIWEEGGGADSTSVKIQVDPKEPACLKGLIHDWQAPHALVGGLWENPGVFGHGGGVLIHKICCHCWQCRVVDTWAQDSTDGQQGLQSVRYSKCSVTREYPAN